MAGDMRSWSPLYRLPACSLASMRSSEIAHHVEMAPLVRQKRPHPVDTPLAPGGHLSSCMSMARIDSIRRPPTCPVRRPIPRIRESERTQERPHPGRAAVLRTRPQRDRERIAASAKVHS